MSAREPSNRTERVAERVREELMRLLLNGEIRDPGAQGVYVSAVQMTSDLKLAKIYVRADPAAPLPRAQKEILRALMRASGFLRSTLAERLGLRYAPALKFYPDEHADRVERVERIFENMHDPDRDPAA
ncbi:MAG: 30S ribosome-binding factor RbfA [Myxococcales bacterium]|nr:30S ribosome-binding factor RbfA [Myxococcales bacterium]